MRAVCASGTRRPTRRGRLIRPAKRSGSAQQRPRHPLRAIRESGGLGVEPGRPAPIAARPGQRGAAADRVGANREKLVRPAVPLHRGEGRDALAIRDRPQAVAERRLNGQGDPRHFGHAGRRRPGPDGSRRAIERLPQLGCGQRAARPERECGARLADRRIGEPPAGEIGQARRARHHDRLVVRVSADPSVEFRQEGRDPFLAAVDHAEVDRVVIEEGADCRPIFRVGGMLERAQVPRHRCRIGGLRPPVHVDPKAWLAVLERLRIEEIAAPDPGRKDAPAGPGAGEKAGRLGRLLVRADEALADSERGRPEVVRKQEGRPGARADGDDGRGCESGPQDRSRGARRRAREAATLLIWRAEWNAPVEHPWHEPRKECRQDGHGREREKGDEAPARQGQDESRRGDRSKRQQRRRGGSCAGSAPTRIASSSRERCPVIRAPAPSKIQNAVTPVSPAALGP